MSLFVVRAFVRLRRSLAQHADLARKLEELEKKYDAQFRVVFDAIRQLMELPERPRRSIGFTPSRSTDLTALRKSKGLSRRFKVEERRPTYRARRPARRPESRAAAPRRRS